MKARQVKKAAANAVKAGQPVASAEAVGLFRRQRWNPLRTLTPETLARALDSFEYGDLREFALLAETIAERDDTLKSVKPKREKATAHRDWNILTTEDSPAAERHKEILEDFWRNVRAENAYDRNERGGLKRLIKQMMTAVSYRYACHHIVWKPRPGQLRAVFEFVPLWFFENREGRLRFIRDGMGITGEEMPESEWMVTTGDGLMVACSIAYVAKRYSLQDWLAFSEKFSMPGIVGTTSAPKGSPEGLAMKNAVETFGQDWAAVLYGVQDTSKPPIHLVSPNGNPSAMPMPALIERVDRKMAALYRGADLSSMSSKDGEGTGASLQGQETDVLDADDCEMISETLREVERHVIAWHFGEGVEPLAYIEIQPPANEDKKREVEIDEALQRLGVRQDPEDIAERYGRDHAGAAVAANAGTWTSFAKETGTLALPRSIMPQVEAGNRAAMVNLLKSYGVDYLRTEMKPADLKPTQAEFSPEKVAAAKSYTGTPRAILVSADNHVVDGHHQWMAALQEAPNEPIPVFKIKAPVMTIIGLILQMRSTRQEKTPAANAAAADALRNVREALAADLQPLGKALEDAMRAGDGAAMQAAIKTLSARIPDFTEAPELSKAMAGLMTAALTTDPEEDDA